MCGGYFQVVLLVWFPAVLSAQGEAQPCPAPQLNGGYVVPQRETYSHETMLSYACDDGFKTAMGGWWASSICQNGKWSHKPQCIDEKSCFPPTIPNANHTNHEDWYEEGEKIRITCEEGYEHKNRDATAVCRNGTWSSVLVCEKGAFTCHEPPQVPHAVIIHQLYKTVFAVDSTVQYQCEDGYTEAGGGNKKSVFCIGGKWTDGPTCRSSRGSGLYDKDDQPLVSEVSRCGIPPTVPNGVVENNQMYLKYQCDTYHKRVGPETVVCYNDGTWSQVPTCKASFCSLDTHAYPELVPVGVKYLRHRETTKLECVRQHQWWTDHFSVARCTNTRLSLSTCCSWVHINLNRC